MKYLRYLAPLILALCVWLLDWFNEQIHVLPSFQSTTILLVGVMPLAELYYLWQRPTHFRYPVGLTFLLLGLHAGAGLNFFFSVQKELGQTAWQGLTLEAWSVRLIGGMAVGIGLLYLLRTHSKQPRYAVDWAKGVLVLLCFGAVAVLALWPGLGLFLHRHGIERQLFWLIPLGSGLLFWGVHLVEVMFLPERQAPDKAGDLIEEIQGLGEREEEPQKREP